MSNYLNENGAGNQPRTSTPMGRSMPVNPPTGGDPGVVQRTRNGLQEEMANLNSLIESIPGITTEAIGRLQAATISAYRNSLLENESVTVTRNPSTKFTFPKIDLRERTIKEMYDEFYAKCKEHKVVGYPKLHAHQAFYRRIHDYLLERKSLNQISEHDYKHQLDILKVYEPESYNFARMEEIEEKRRGRIRLQKEAEELAVPTPKGCPRPPICGSYSKVDAAVVKEFETRLGVEKGPTTTRAWKNYLQRAAEVIAQYGLTPRAAMDLVGRFADRSSIQALLSFQGEANPSHKEFATCWNLILQDKCKMSRPEAIRSRQEIRALIDNKPMKRLTVLIKMLYEMIHTLMENECSEELIQPDTERYFRLHIQEFLNLWYVNADAIIQNAESLREHRSILDAYLAAAERINDPVETNSFRKNENKNHKHLPRVICGKSTEYRPSGNSPVRINEALGTEEPVETYQEVTSDYDESQENYYDGLHINDVQGRSYGRDRKVGSKPSGPRPQRTAGNSNKSPDLSELVRSTYGLPPYDKRLADQKPPGGWPKPIGYRPAGGKVLHVRREREVTSREFAELIPDDLRGKCLHCASDHSYNDCERHPIHYHILNHLKRGACNDCELFHLGKCIPTPEWRTHIRERRQRVEQVRARPVRGTPKRKSPAKPKSNPMLDRMDRLQEAVAEQMSSMQSQIDSMSKVSNNKSQGRRKRSNKPNSTDGQSGKSDSPSCSGRRQTSQVQ